MSPQPMVMTKSLFWTASPVSTFRVAAVMSMPSSAMAATATGLIWSAGSVPAERTSMRSPARWVSSAAAIWERPALWTQTKRTLGLSAISADRLAGVGSEESGAQGQGDVDQADQHGHFDERFDDAG
ncbi:hypothetical protein LAUMK13_02037 [Mycobacterium innocens]|uniref:Secreted protein n=1 Tax=Mycobacterium innocens TaxID=2341083 RepID=A0A498PZ37_9MYCO|nr:hypothetical protein LAUMK13_02037 [Mycobacterium innocens]